MKKEFNKAEIEIIKLSEEDVIKTSTPGSETPEYKPLSGSSKGSGSIYY